VRRKGIKRGKTWRRICWLRKPILSRNNLQKVKKKKGGRNEAPAINASSIWGSTPLNPNNPTQVMFGSACGGKNRKKKEVSKNAADETYAR